MEKQWHNNKELSAGHFRLRLLFMVYRLLGARALKVFVTPVAFFTFCFAKAQRDASLGFFARLYAFTGNKKYRPSLYKSLKHFLSFSFSLVRRLQAWDGKLGTGSIDFMEADLRTEILADVEEGKGHFILSSHMGNMEMLRGVAFRSDMKINAFINMVHTRQFSDFLSSVNSSNAFNVYSTSDIGLETAILMQEKLKNGEIVVMAADRLAERNAGRYIEVDFLGSRARLPLGAFKFAKLMETDVYSYFIFEEGGRFKAYTLKYPQDSSEKECARLFAGKMEELAQLYPYQWFNFYDYFYN